ncbi:MAG: non-canonical purine NTP pyrophosphatase [Candidatus Staskawiczbacteria bacterium]|jgi:XTP/dITP diphosphohydrolase
MKILIGTNNYNKFNDYKIVFNIFAPKFELLRPKDLNIEDDIEEAGKTLAENAILKAKFFGKKSGIITISDDTGLFVDSLNGEPGLHAKRWHNGTEHDRCVKLLERLKGKDRKAKYIWGFAVYNPKNDKAWVFEHIVEGLISDEFKNGGFGYDPIFKLKLMDKYYSQLTDVELAKIGGRGVAVKELLKSNFLK